MSKEQNINPLTNDSPPSTENENISEENIQHTTLNTQHNEENMEVHKHPHHVTRKKEMDRIEIITLIFSGFKIALALPFQFLI